MITQNFVKEFEMALYRSYGRANSSVRSRSQHEPNFVGDTTYKEQVVKIFSVESASRCTLIYTLTIQGLINPA